MAEREAVGLSLQRGPRVSIVMPCYNAAAFLREALTSVVEQSFTDWELLLVDDGSTDDPASIVREFQDPRIIYIRTEGSGGPSRPRNLAIGRARGTHVFFLDADDAMRPGKLAAQMALFAAEPDLGLVFTNFRVIDPQGAVTDTDFLARYATFKSLRLEALSPSGRFERTAFVRALMRANFVGTSSVGVRRDVLAVVGGFDENLVSSEDLDLWLRIARDYDFGFVDMIGHSYRKHPGSLMHEFDTRHPRARIVVLNRHLSLVDDIATIRAVHRRLAANHVSLGYIHEVRGEFAVAARYYLASLRHATSRDGVFGAIKCAIRRLVPRRGPAAAVHRPAAAAAGAASDRQPAPKVSLGLPVYNGANFLRHALESLAGQTLRDLEIVISDNASTDETEAICREFAARDPRIRYIRQERNIGAGPNYNYVYHQSRGRYFKWAAHDDYMDPEAIALCAAALDADPAAVLCHPRLVDVDEHGKFLAEFDRGVTGSGPVVERFFQVIQMDHNCAEVFGLTRRDALDRTGLIRDYTDSDRTLLGELALQGLLRQVDGASFYRRIHGSKSDRVYRSFHERAVWFNPGNKDKIVLSASNQLRDLFVSLVRCRLSPADKGRCLWRLAKVAKWNLPLYRRELAWAWRRARG